jgi:hypothetical protein
MPRGAASCPRGAAWPGGASCPREQLMPMGSRITRGSSMPGEAAYAAYEGNFVSGFDFEKQL